MGEAQDARAARTQAKIKQALVKLIAEKGFDALTVSDITRAAHINRGTFYLHFIDKNDMLEQLEGEAISAISDAFLSNIGPTENPNDILAYNNTLTALEVVAADKEFIAAIAGPGGDPDFDRKLRSIFERLLDAALEQSGLHLLIDDTFSEEYSRELLVGHVLTIVNVWLEHGGRETPEQVAHMIEASKELPPTHFVH